VVGLLLVVPVQGHVLVAVVVEAVCVVPQVLSA